MPHTILTAILLVAMMMHIGQAIPVSQNHRFTVYTPYWHQGSHPHFPQEAPRKFPDCATDLCDIKPNLPPLLANNDFSNSIPILKTTKRNKPMYKTGIYLSSIIFE
ncbi:hypothetical protein J6590_058802 [Homalodisca vitripennis]|nr:hypothetical protein J6590_058802 [Homalodisca vitripennis]